MTGTPITDAAEDQVQAFMGGTLVVASGVARDLERKLAATRAELERERIRLAACGVVALANTPESAARAREMHDEYRSASCDDAARAVDEQMRLRAELEQARKAEGSEQESLEAARRLLGHVDPRTTNRHYRTKPEVT